MAKRKIKVKKTASGKVDKRTKQGKAIADRLAKARAAKERKSKFSWLFGKKKKKK